MPDSLCLITLGSVTMQIKLVSFLRLIVSSCMAELDLFKLTCRTLMILFCTTDSGIGGKEEAMINYNVLPLLASRHRISS